MDKQFKIYKVGGCVRDALLGVKSKDIDFSFEFSEEFVEKFKDEPVSGFYETMNKILEKEGFEIFLETPKAFTTRAKFPSNHVYSGLTADFVLCRKESYPDPDTRMPKVEIGTLFDDLQRRDFTVNAIAEDEDGNLIDPFNGVKDIKDKILKCPINAKTSFNDDPLRMLRALRFAITKGFKMSSEVSMVILADEDMWEKFSKVVSQERIREEVFKMFKHDTIEALDLLCTLQMNSPVNVMEKIFANGMWLKPTFENVK